VLFWRSGLSTASHAGTPHPPTAMGRWSYYVQPRCVTSPSVPLVSASRWFSCSRSRSGGDQHVGGVLESTALAKDWGEPSF